MNKLVVPGQSAGFGLPFILEVAIIRPAIEEAVELLVYQRTRTGFVQWVRIIPHPIPIEQITPPQIIQFFFYYYSLILISGWNIGGGECGIGIVGGG